MDWTYPLTGLDLSQVWDPELWLQFKQAVVWNTPEVFWDKLWDRISYSEWHDAEHLLLLQSHCAATLLQSHSCSHTLAVTLLQSHWQLLGS
jgi:hypothetical protein